MLRGIARSPEARGLTDDCAVFGDLVLTHDMMVAGTHFPLDADPADVAWKLVAVNLSDLAAKGAEPLGLLLGHMLGDGDWDGRFVAGLGQALAAFDVQLWGGDTVAAPVDQPLRAIGLTALGRATHLPVPARSGATPGDALWVTGTIGDAMLGFELDSAGQTAPARPLARFRRPAPRLTEGRMLAPLATAMMDVSDGLLLDASRMALASGVSMEIDSAAVPVAPELTTERRGEAMRWGDDYELLFTLPDSVAPPCAATRIGIIVADAGVPLLVDGAVPDETDSLGYQHSR